jgi:hypothetical protein|tara:strand:- start:565 stop:756 length:192 start_codon:yes stop_codon:yes gene_type:complete
MMDKDRLEKLRVAQIRANDAILILKSTDMHFSREISMLSEVIEDLQLATIIINRKIKESEIVN